LFATTRQVVSGWAFIGEVDKYVPASKLRFPEVAPAADAL
jgi:hypothetical protein